MIEELSQFIHNVRIDNPSQQTKELRQCLQYCWVTWELTSEIINIDYRNEKIQLNQDDYITDLDLTDLVIRNSDQLYTLWKAQKILRSQIPIEISNSIWQSKSTQSSILRQHQSIDQELIAGGLENLQTLNFGELFKSLQNSSHNWILDLIKSMVPYDDPNMSHHTSPDKYCWLDFMSGPKFDNGNPRWLLTLQAMAQLKIKEENQAGLIDWLLAKPKSITASINEDNWYTILLSHIRYELFYNTLKSLLEIKQNNPNLTYYGWSQDFEIDQQKQNPDYKKIFKNIFFNHSNQAPNFKESILKYDLFKNDRISPIQLLLKLSKQIQVLLVSKQNIQEIIHHLRIMINTLSQSQSIPLETQNISIRLRLYYQWALLANYLDHQKAQILLQESVSFIEIDMQQPQPNNTQQQLVSLSLIIDLLNSIEDIDFVQTKFAEYFNKFEDFEIIKFYLMKLNFDDEKDKFTTLIKLIQQSHYTQYTIQKLIELIKFLFEKIQLPDQALFAYTELLKQILLLYQPKPRNRNNPYQIINIKSLLQEIFQIKQEKNINNDPISECLCNIVGQYLKMKELHTFLDVSDLLVNLFQLPIEAQIQEIWTYKLLKMCARNASSAFQNYTSNQKKKRIQLGELFDRLIRLNYMIRVCNLKILITQIPFENDDHFIKYILS